jgi:hypothetical protein
MPLILLALGGHGRIRQEPAFSHHVMRPASQPSLRRICCSSCFSNDAVVVLAARATFAVIQIAAVPWAMPYGPTPKRRCRRAAIDEEPRHRLCREMPYLAIGFVSLIREMSSAGKTPWLSASAVSYLLHVGNRHRLVGFGALGGTLLFERLV